MCRPVLMFCCFCHLLFAHDVSLPQVEFNSACVVFSGGTDPDDVRQGLIGDGWLLAAVCMLAGAGGIGDGGVDEQIARLIVHRPNGDGNLSCDSEVPSPAAPSRLF